MKKLLSYIPEKYLPLAIITALVIAVGSGVFLFKKVGDLRNNVAIQKTEDKAQQAEDKALNHEGRADAAKAQADALDPQRIAAEKRVAELQKQVAAGEKLLAERKRQLDEARNNKGSIDRSGTLDEREQRLLARLETAYPDN